DTETLLIFSLFVAEQAGKRCLRRSALGRLIHRGSGHLGLLYSCFLSGLGPPRLGLPRRLLRFHFLLACRAGPLGSLCFLCLRLLPLLRHDRSPDRFTETLIP